MILCAISRFFPPLLAHLAHGTGRRGRVLLCASRNSRGIFKRTLAAKVCSGKVFVRKIVGVGLVYFNQT